MLTSSESWFTTHASPDPRTATETGSRPTGISATSRGEVPVTSNTASWSSAVLTASSRVPSGVIASGWT